MKKSTKELDTIYGKFEITEPVLIDLLDSQAMQRLKKIHQLGIAHYVNKSFGSYTRYDHSIGVFVLLRRYKQSLPEQIAGLLHDASHTIFSHVADYLFGNAIESDSSYQDQIHQWYLEKTDIAKIVRKHGYNLEDLLHKNDEFRALEQSLPNLCADRIEYTLYEYALGLGLTNQAEVRERIEYLLNSLHFKDGQWFFDKVAPARFYAELVLNFVQKSWATDRTMYTYTMAARMLQRALDINLITYDTIHFGADDEVWQKFKDCNDQQIQDYLDKICHYQNAYRLSNVHDYNMHLKGKFRGVDPYVLTSSGRLERLSHIDQVFAKEFGMVKEHIAAGVYIKSLV